MNRLIQGDVGSGKTLIAVLSMLMAIDNGYQACLMAPTEILAQQHAKSLQDFLGDLPINIALLTGSTTKKRRAEIAEGLTNGSINMIVGTHALLEDTVQFQNIGLCVIDEQHRFGVAQRAKLWKKNNVMPHVLVMTATPIPRTLAMTLYGDLDVSVIDELPPGRKPIRTTMLRDTQRQKMYDLIKEQIAQGRQIYIVYPLIQESERMDFKNLETKPFAICVFFLYIYLHILLFCDIIIMNRLVNGGEKMTFEERKALVRGYLGKTVTIGIDRPVGYVHHKEKYSLHYPINYGYIPGVLGGDGEELDVYLLGVSTPVTEYTCRIIGIAHRENDVEDKLIAAPDGMHFTVEEMAAAINFQEKYYDTTVEGLN